jgi:hypothetical protein
MFFIYVYWNFHSHFLTRCSTIINYLSSKQFLKDCFLDFTETFNFNILQVKWSIYSPFTLESIISIDKDFTVLTIVGLDCIQYPG